MTNHQSSTFFLTWIAPNLTPKRLKKQPTKHNWQSGHFWLARLAVDWQASAQTLTA
jgi:hypothetical protein